MQLAFACTLATAAVADDAVTVSGVLASVKSEHPNGSTFTALVMAIDRKIEIKGKPGEDSCATEDRNEVQLAGKPLPEKLVGKKVEVTGSPFCQHTAWHIRPVLIDVTEFREVAPKQ